MSFKKVLVALGLVCVVAPAALAASMMINRGEGGPADGAALGPVEAMLGSLLQMMRSPGEIGEGKIPHRAGPGNGNVALPFRPANVLAPDLATIMELKFGKTEVEDVMAASFVGGAAGALGGPIGTQRSGAPQNDSRSAPSFASAGAGNGFGGIRGIGGADFGGAGGSGAGGSGGSAVDLALQVDMSEPPATGGGSDEPIASTPLPATVWMLMASMLGLSFLRRRSRPA